MTMRGTANLSTAKLAAQRQWQIFTVKNDYIKLYTVSIFLVHYLGSCHKSKTFGISRVTGMSSAILKAP